MTTPWDREARAELDVMRDDALTVPCDMIHHLKLHQKHTPIRPKGDYYFHNSGRV